MILQGYHVWVDGSAFQTSHWTPELVRDFCHDAVRMAKMTLISGPFAASSAEGNVVGVAVLAESHVAAHLSPQRGEAHFDLFSCKPFPPEAFALLAVERFGLREWKMGELRR